MKKILAAIFLVGLLTTGCGNQTPAPQPEQKTEEKKPAFEEAVEPVKDAANAATDAAAGAAGAAVDAAADAANNAANAAVDAANTATDAAAGAATNAANAAAGAVNDAANAVKDMIPEAEKPDMISSAPSIGTTRESFEMYNDGQYTAEYDADGRVVSMTINTSYIDNDMLASILPSDVVVTSFDTNSSDATKQVNHFQGTSAQLKLVNPASNGKFEAFTNFDKQTSQFLGGTITVVTAP